MELKQCYFKFSTVPKNSGAPLCGDASKAPAIPISERILERESDHSISYLGTVRDVCRISRPSKCVLKIDGVDQSEDYIIGKLADRFRNQSLCGFADPVIDSLYRGGLLQICRLKLGAIILLASGNECIL